jgi:RecB family exonuclease
MHATLKSFYEKVSQGSRPDKRLALSCLEENWAPEGYTSKTHERKFFEKGKFYLEGFLKESFNPKILPAVMEQPFTIPIGSDLKIGGKIDRVDALGGGEIEIIDYKTGATIPSQADVDRDLQLSFYALAASSIPTEPFGKKPNKIRLSLYFLDVQEKFSTVRTAEELEKARKEIYRVKEEIEKSDFKCSGNMLCEKCEYSLFCRSEV